MKTSSTLLLFAATSSLTHAARIGLLRMGNLPQTGRHLGVAPKYSAFSSALFDEDLQSSLRELFGRDLQVAASMSMSIDYTPPVTPPVTPPIAEPLPPPKSPPVVSPPVAATTAPPVAAPVAATTAPPVAAPTPLPIDETTAPTPAATEPLVEALLTGAPTPDPSEINSNDDPTDPPSGEEDTASLTGNLAAVGTGASSASMNGSMIAMIATLSVAAVAVAAALVVRHKKKTSDRSNDGVSDMSSLVSLSGHEGL